jgi:deazaflavin-dependent oxidoreductase (nitroreductase family)
MNDAIRRALAHDLTIDLTTTGRRTGEARTVEIWFLNIDGRLFITGTPGKRDWYANLLADPRLVFHLKGSVQASLPGSARPVLDEPTRRSVLTAASAEWYRGQADIEALVATAPMVEITLDDV